MKRTLILAALLPFFLISCGGSESTDGSDNVNDADSLSADFSDMEEISLKPDGLNMKMMLPAVASSTGNAIEPKVEHDEGDYLWYVTIGPRFQLIIEDYGKEQSKVDGEKKRLSELENIFDIEYFIEEPGLIMYKRTLHEGQGGKPSYHCYGEVTIDGYSYVLRSEDEGSLKPIIEDMVKTIRSATPIATT